MKTRNVIAALLAAAVFSTSAFADAFTPYAKANVSYDWGDGWQDSVDRASRIGAKGEFQITGNTSFVYQVEQGVDLAHGGNELDSLFSVRNSFVGLKGEFGTVFWGAHDTPFKKMQGKVDRFNDQQGDIKTLFVGEVRARDSYGYRSPKINGWSALAMHVPGDSRFGSSQSIGLSYGKGAWKFGFGVDEDMRKNEKTASKTKVFDSVRVSAEYAFSNWSMGLVAQGSEQQNVGAADREYGYLLSLGYSLGKATLLAQHGQSDIVESGARSTNLGLDYKWRANFKTYVGYWNYAGADSEDQVSLGFEYKI